MGDVIYLKLIQLLWFVENHLSILCYDPTEPFFVVIGQNYEPPVYINDP